MGRRGPLKKSRLLGGDYLKATRAGGDRRGDDLDDLLALPAGLTAGAARRWQTLAPLLANDGRLKTDTRETLVTYCRLADEADVLGEQLTKEGVIVETPHGEFANPKTKILAGVRSTLLRFSQALGLDPVSKARLGAAGVIDTRTADEKAEDAEFSKFFA